MREDTTRLDEVLATDSKTPPKTATYTADAANASRDLPRTFELTFDNQQRPRSRRPISIVGKLRITSRWTLPRVGGEAASILSRRCYIFLVNSGPE